MNLSISDHTFSGVVANKQELERHKISVWYYFQNVSIKTQLHNLNLGVKIFGIHMIGVFNHNTLNVIGAVKMIILLAKKERLIALPA